MNFYLFIGHCYFGLCWRAKLMWPFAFYLKKKKQPKLHSPFWPRHAACETLFPRPGIRPVAPAVEALNLNHWTASQVPWHFQQYSITSCQLSSTLVLLKLCHEKRNTASCAYHLKFIYAVKFSAVTEGRRHDSDHFCHSSRNRKPSVAWRHVANSNERGKVKH